MRRFRTWIILTKNTWKTLWSKDINGPQAVQRADAIYERWGSWHHWRLRHLMTPLRINSLPNDTVHVAWSSREVPSWATWTSSPVQSLERRPGRGRKPRQSDWRQQSPAWQLSNFLPGTTAEIDSINWLSKMYWKTIKQEDLVKSFTLQFSTYITLSLNNDKKNILSTRRQQNLPQQVPKHVYK